MKYYTKKCITPLCDEIIVSSFNQTKYCPLCSVKRVKILELYRSIKRQKYRLEKDISKMYRINSAYLNNILMLNIVDRDNTKKELKIMATEFDSGEMYILVKYVYKAYKYIAKIKDKLSGVIK